MCPECHSIIASMQWGSGGRSVGKRGKNHNHNRCGFGFGGHCDRLHSRSDRLVRPVFRKLIPVGRVRTFIEDLDRRQLVRHALFAICAGLAGAAASMLLCICVDTANRFNMDNFWALYLLPVMGILGTLLYKSMKLDVFMTTNNVIEKMRKNEKVSPLLAPGILLGTCLSILGGASVGKEAGALQMGASIGDTMARPFKLQSIRKSKQDGLQHDYAASIGMAATFSALFFAPLGSTFFVWELSRYKRSIFKHFISIFVACFIGANITRNIGIGDIIPTVDIPPMTVDLFFMAVIVSIVTGVSGALFGTILRKMQKANQQLVKNPFISVLIGSAIILLLVLLCDWRMYDGLGSTLVADALAGNADTWGFAIKGCLTLLALGFLFKGGEIMPMFTIGSLLGCSMGHVLGISAPFASMLGLITFFCAATRCPLAALFMGIEVFGIDAAPYMLVGVLCAYSSSFDFGIYGHGIGREVRIQSERFPRLSKVLSITGSIDDQEAPIEGQNVGGEKFVDTFEEAVDPKRFMKTGKRK